MSLAQTILFPTDFSERSQAVFPLACSLARDQKARLLVLYVDPPPQFHDELVDRRREGYAQALWDGLHRFQPPDPAVRVERHLAEGKPDDEILRVAREEKCDLIVLPTHGRTGLSRLLMGSVAEQVLRRAPCPVLTVSAPGAAG
jgi:nucleotide-binding universal stress UspA family protein